MLGPVSTWMGDRPNYKYAGAVRRCTRILWPGTASEKTPRGVIPPVEVKYRLKKNKQLKVQSKECVHPDRQADAVYA
jgi:hypothetical protein